MSGPILELAGIAKRFGPTVVADALSLSVQAGEFFTFLGPSGSGKSSILRMVAGLETPDSGRILIDGRDVSATMPWQRNLGMMFQSYAIFPHMTAAQNIAYGLEVRRASASRIEARVREMIDLVGLAGKEDKNATLLSGGEQQRVALARALAPEPRILLLDEPLSALDENIRRLMQSELKRIHKQTGTTFLYVTHDQEEALTMSDRIAVFDRGRCVECGHPEQLYRRPQTRFVASFFRGCNILEARCEASGLSLSGVPLEGVATAAHDAGALVPVAVRAENVHVGPPWPRHAVKLAATLGGVTFRGTVLDYDITLGDGQSLTASSTRQIEMPADGRLEIQIAADALIVLAD